MNEAKLKTKLHLRMVLIAMALAFPFWVLLFFFKQKYDCCKVIGLFQVIVLVIIAPITEEIIFRGAIQTFLSQRNFELNLGWLSLSNLITSCLFSASHFLLNHSIEILLVFFPSLIFGYLREKSNSLMGSIVVHGFYNLGFVSIYLFD
ncbi:MAG: JDVT-CTERM system glutamic-type intramembrane protease [Betaproteobacteria bacterium]|jgi:membrane protease YdiL (CAAX protease family)